MSYKDPQEKKEKARRYWLEIYSLRPGVKERQAQLRRQRLPTPEVIARRKEAEAKRNLVRRGNTQFLTAQVRYRRKLKQEVIDAYGGRCVCCGETNPAFLTIDHKNNDGAAEKKGVRNGAGAQYYRKLRQLKWPGHLQLMCYNCNCSRHFWNRGRNCPHSDRPRIQAILLLQPEGFV